MIFILILTLLCIICVFSLCYYLTFPAGTEDLKNLEGPPTQWVFGNALQFPNNMADFTTLCLKWWNQYKSPMKVKLMHQNVVHLYKAEHLEAITKDLNNITKSKPYHLLMPWLGTGLLTSTNDKWRDRRKLLTPTFHYQILQEFFPIFNEQAEILVKIFNEKANSGESFDVCPSVTRCTLDIICESAMGKNINAQRNINSDYVNALNKFTDAFVYRILRPWLHPEWIWTLTSRGKIYSQSMKLMHDFTNEIISERENQLSAEIDDVFNLRTRRRKAFLDLLLEMKRDGKLNAEDVQEEVETFMFEVWLKCRTFGRFLFDTERYGHDTTASGIFWALYCLGHYPEIQQQLYEEISTVCGTDDKITMEHIADLKLLDRCIKETLRLYAAVPQIGRKTTHPLEIGTKIPVGTQLELILLMLHRDPEWFPEPMKFDPDRFLPENVEKRHPFAFCPFSAGPRNCIGQKFATLEEKVVLSHVLRNFHVESVQPQETMQILNQFVTRPANGIWLKLTTRN